jgi:hypothetical protein
MIYLITGVVDYSSIIATTFLQAVSIYYLIVTSITILL